MWLITTHFKYLFNDTENTTRLTFVASAYQENWDGKRPSKKVKWRNIYIKVGECHFRNIDYK